MELFLFCTALYLIAGLIITLWQFDFRDYPGGTIYWRMIILWPGAVAVVCLLWIAHLLGFRIH